MFRISKYGMIELTRGDTLIHPIYINDGTKINHIRHVLKQNEELYFGLIEPNMSFENAVLKKVYNFDSPKTIDGDTLLMLSPSDTECLLPGRYFYTIKLKKTHQNGLYDVDTIVPMTEFWIL